MKTGIIYIIKNTVNSKVYIGQSTSDVQTRFRQHLKKSTLSSRHYKIYNAIKKYGRDKFYIEILEENIPVEKLDEREIYYIELYNSFDCGYNSSKGGDGRVINKSYDENKIIESYLNGLSMNQICKYYNVSNATISRVLKRLKIETRHDGNKYDGIDIDTFTSEWYDKNISIRDMALKYKVDEKTIRRYSIRWGLKRKGTNMNGSNLEIQIVLWNKSQRGHTTIDRFASDDIDGCSSVLDKINDKKIMILIGPNPISYEHSFADDSLNFMLNYCFNNHYNGCIVLNVFSRVEENLQITREKIDVEYLNKQVRFLNNHLNSELCLFYGPHIVAYLSKYRLNEEQTIAFENYQKAIAKHNALMTIADDKFIRPTSVSFSKLCIKNIKENDSWIIKGKQ